MKRHLSLDKQAQVNAFIVKAVMANASFDYTSSFGKSEPQTAQQLVHTNANTLKKIGIQLEKVVSANGSSRFSKHNRLQIPAHSGIYAEEWLEFIELCMDRQLAIAEDVEASDELKAIEKELEALETPEERKKKLLERKSAIVGDAVPA